MNTTDIFKDINNLAIFIATSETNINNVNNQKPNIVSLILNLNTMDLTPQIFGGNGGQSFYRNINPNNPDEKFLAMRSVKVPFRKPQQNETSVLKAIETFCKNYKKLLIENYDLLRYPEFNNYELLLLK